MFKKILLLVSFLGLLHAQGNGEIWIYVSTDPTVPGIDKNEIAVSAGTEVYDANKSWIGIYKVGASNEWKNVQAWTWLPKEWGDYFPMDISEISPGEYEARVFFNNSYKMEAKSLFTIKPSKEKPFIKLDKKIGNSSIDVSHSIGPKAWIGIYPVGSSTDWSNVKSWKWAEKDGTTNIPVAFLERGTYEARLFYHNSYVVEDKFTFGPVGGGPGGGFSPIKKDLVFYSNGLLHQVIKLEFGKYGATTEKPWIGIYKKGATISKQNLVARGDLQQDNTKSWVILETFNQFGYGDYDMVYHPTSNFIYVGERKTFSFVPGLDY